MYRGLLGNSLFSFVFLSLSMTRAGNGPGNVSRRKSSRLLDGVTLRRRVGNRYSVC
jgi:hypothetical protein